MDFSKATPQQISDYKRQWKPNGHPVELHSDLHIDGKDWCRHNLERWRWSMDTFTDVYEHTFWFQLKNDADKFKEHFEKVIYERSNANFG